MPRAISEMASSQAMLIRPIRPEDAAGLTEILQDAPEAARWRLEDAASQTATAPGVRLVAESGQEIVGFVMARQVLDEAEILNIAVKRSHRRCGVGAALLLAALKDAQAQGAARVFLEVRESNAAAIAFYRKHGFRQTGRRRGYYRDPDEDALLFERKLTG